MKRMNWLLAGILFLAIADVDIASAALGDYFVETDWLAANRATVRIVDVRNPALYLLGHIGGGVNIYRNEFLSKRHGVKSLILSVAEFEKLMDQYGITPDTTVVAYAEHTNPYMARFVWTLRYHGHEKSYVLNGGYEKWVQEGRDKTIIPVSVTPGIGYRVTESEDIRVDGDYVLTRLNNPSVTIWDTRRESEYTGREVRADRGGHIPGAVHLEWVNLMKTDNGVKVLKSEEEIKGIFKTLGLNRDKEIIAHCQTGIRSAYATLVLLALGYNAKNYDGSWTEWANCSNYPVEGSAGQANLSTEVLRL